MEKCKLVDDSDAIMPGISLILCQPFRQYQASDFASNYASFRTPLGQVLLNFGRHYATYRFFIISPEKRVIWQEKQFTLWSYVKSSN